ncbi:MAG: hypothetical protein Q4E03_04745 [Trueperella sp.]|nr:hypothetical protein [Trueperella sp.]
METWLAPQVPELPGTAPTLQLFDTATGSLREYSADTMRLWVCGITPYDATHLGHANTYVAFDTLCRVWQDGGRALKTAQNLTDIDDPLFAHAAANGLDWQELAASQTELFRSDMAALRVLPPQIWRSVSETLDQLEETVRGMEAAGLAYRLDLPDGSQNVYADLAADPQFATCEALRGAELIELFDNHGGDSELPGKKNPLDPQLWKGVRGDDYRPHGGKPGDWRPGWHIECALLALDHLGRIDVQGGGSDLVFPHHEMSESHMRVLTAGRSQVQFHVHSGMVGYDGEKMSKSLGNLVLVSQLRADGIDPNVIRLVLLTHHYRSDWEYGAQLIREAQRRYSDWRAGAHAPVDAKADTASSATAEQLLASMREALAHDLDTPRALRVVDDCLRRRTSWESTASRALAIAAVDALLGVAL